jgi:hypothetical protein
VVWVVSPPAADVGGLVVFLELLQAPATSATATSPTPNRMAQDGDEYRKPFINDYSFEYVVARSRWSEACVGRRHQSARVASSP